MRDRGRLALRFTLVVLVSRVLIATDSTNQSVSRAPIGAAAVTANTAKKAMTSNSGRLRVSRPKKLLGKGSFGGLGGFVKKLNRSKTLKRLVPGKYRIKARQILPPQAI
jgi:hypothetical protein